MNESCCVWSYDAGERNSDKCIHVERRVSSSQCTVECGSSMLGWEGGRVLRHVVFISLINTFIF